MSTAQKRSTIAAAEQGSILARCRALDLSRSSYYYKTKGESELNLELMRVMDQEFTLHSFHGVMGMRDFLRLDGYWVNEKRVRRLMRIMGLEAVAPKPDLSRPGKGHKRWPYLLRGLKIEGPDHVWSTDITYIPMAKGFLYLTAVMDWYSRYVISWRISNSLDTAFCLEALHGALLQRPAPRIFNTDQGSQFTSAEFTGALLAEGIAISMDGKGRATDNAFIERLWRTVKQQCIYRNAPSDGHELHQILSEFFAWYNHHRPHQHLDGLTPAHLYLGLPDTRPKGVKPTLKQPQPSLTIA
ncbi:MAG: IS3 family transposase [Bacteroidetes bacterium]|nr:IS3 family transposase [Bacteroidota bacterium]